MSVRVICGDCREVLPTLPEALADCCVTSPPYFGLRDYGDSRQIGLEASLEAYVGELVAVFRQVARVLRPDGTLWLNLGDCYSQSGRGTMGQRSTLSGSRRCRDASRAGLDAAGGRLRAPEGRHQRKNLLGVPWRVAFALQEDGWYLRQDVVWSKTNPQPESVRDRPTRAHEYVFLLSRSRHYYYDAAAVAERATGKAPGNKARHKGAAAFDAGDARMQTKRGLAAVGARDTRNLRSVWSLSSEPYHGAHHAVMPTRLVRPCVLAGSRPEGVVLDPFAGAGTVGRVARALGRSAVLVELNPEYADMAETCAATPVRWREA